jgi:hypothetical protein
MKVSPVSMPRLTPPNAGCRSTCRNMCSFYLSGLGQASKLRLLITAHIARLSLSMCPKVIQAFVSDLLMAYATPLLCYVRGLLVCW